MLLTKVQELAPEVLADLRDRVAREPVEARPAAIEAWARRSGFTQEGKAPRRLIAQANLTLDCWERHPELRSAGALCWGERYGGSYRHPGILNIPVAIGHRDESKAERRKRMRQEALAAIDQFLEDYSFKYTPEHLEWLVRFQIKRETPEEIAARPLRIGIAAVEHALRATARLIGITLRPSGRRPGRPRKSKT